MHGVVCNNVVGNVIPRSYTINISRERKRVRERGERWTWKEGYNAVGM